MSMYDPDELERAADERARRLDADWDAHQRDDAYRAGAAATAFAVRMWLDAQPDGSEPWADRVREVLDAASDC